MRGNTTNWIAARSAYPTAAGQSIGTAGSTNSVPEQPDTPKGESEPIAVTTGGRPLVWWLVLVGMFIGLGFLAQRYGSQGATFGHIRISFYNVLIMTLAVIVGLNFAKLIVSFFPVPKALKTVVLSA